MPKSRKNTQPTVGRNKRKIKESCNGDKIGNGDGDFKEHPLLNHLVLEGIFPHLNVQDLKHARQVCKLWHSTSLKIWRSQATVALGPPSLDTTIPSCAWPVNQFCRNFQDSNDSLQLAEKPFTRITLKDIDFQQCQLFQTSDVPEGSFNFWSVIGPLITHLHFCSCTFHGDSRQVFGNILTEKLPNLEMLQLTDNNTSNVTGWRCLQDLNESEYRTEADSLQISNLKTLKIFGNVPMCPATLVLNSPNMEALQAGGYRDFHVLHTAKRVKLHLDRVPLQLKHLELMEPFENEFGVWDEWFPQNSPLEYLAFSVTTYPRYDQGIAINCLVRRYANTLQVLKLFRSPAYRVLRECPLKTDMPVLRELHLFGNIVKSFGFLSLMPNLEVLYVDYQCLDKKVLMEDFYQKVTETRRYIPFGRTKHLSLADSEEFLADSLPLEKLKILHLNAEIHPKQISRLAELLPNVKTLRTVLHNKGFEQVCTHFSNLEELVLLFGSKVSTGSGKADHKIVLKKLKRFELHALCYSSSDEFRINDKIVYQFLLKCPDLQHVYISASKLMTSGAEEALRRHVCNVTVV